MVFSGTSCSCFLSSIVTVCAQLHNVNVERWKLGGRRGVCDIAQASADGSCFHSRVFRPASIDYPDDDTVMMTLGNRYKNSGDVRLAKRRRSK